MRVIYVASVFDDECLKKRFDGKPVLPYAASKYNTLLFEGIVKNRFKTDVISVVPIRKDYYKKLFFKGYTSKTDDLKVRYLSQINIPIFKNIFNILGGFLRTVFAPKNSILIYDVLVVSASIGAICAAKLRRFKKVGIVTDLPKFLGISKNSYMLKMNNRIIRESDGYVFLTKQMNNEVNVDRKPYLVLEGHVNEDMKEKKHMPFTEQEKKILYAGSIEKIYGIEMLCKAFIDVALPNEELHIFGNGDFAEELRKLAEKNDNIVYHGNRPNNEIVEEELRATLLVNPRPTDGEYTKFSFPSKTLEYMVSGTPVLSSRLAGIPEEYENYIFYFDENTAENLGKRMREILNLSPEILAKKGEDARNFALDKKNNVTQSKKIIELCLMLYDKEKF